MPILNPYILTLKTETDEIKKNTGTVSQCGLIVRSLCGVWCYDMTVTKGALEHHCNSSHTLKK